MTKTKWIVPVLGLLFCLGAPAQADDVAYCKALAQTYERYVVKIDTGHTVQRGSTDASLALEQCRNGNIAGIPVLERELKRAKVDLPARG
jgi:hypothetical protein